MKFFLKRRPRALKWIWHTPRYSIRSSTIYPICQITTFSAKMYFLVFNMGHTMNKLTYECTKNQLYNNLVDLQCKYVRQDTPRIGPIWGFPAVEQSKVFLKFFNFKKPTTCFSPKSNFGERHVVRFLKFKNVKNTFDCSTAAYYWGQTLNFIFRPTFPKHWSCQPLVIYIFGKGFKHTFWWDNLKYVLHFKLSS